MAEARAVKGVWLTTPGHGLGIELWLHQGPREAWVTLRPSSVKGHASFSRGVTSEDDIDLSWKT